MLDLFDTHSHQYYSLPGFNLHHLIVSTQPEDWLVQFNQTKDSPNAYFAIGVHPWYAQQINLDKFANFISEYSIDAIGEIGLDFYPEYAMSRVLQLDIFNQQLQFATNYNLPVSIHSRKSLSEVYASLKTIGGYGFMHGFNGSFQQADLFIRLGFKIGFNGIICSPHAHRYHALVRAIALKDIVVESDFPFVKDSSQKAIMVDRVVTRIAELKGVTFEEVATVTYQNAIDILVRRNGRII